MRRILVISDVHGHRDLLDRILKEYNDVDMKIYLGDFQMSISNQREYSKMFDYVVTGNCDYTNVSPITEIVEIYGKKVFITHGHYFGSLMQKIDFSTLYKKAKKNDCEVILHGHDHIAVVETELGITRFNPGSTTLPRNTRYGTFGIIEIDDNNEWNFVHIKVA